MVKVKRSSSEISSSSDTAVDILNSSCDNVSEHKPAKKQKKAEVKGEKPDSPGKYQKRNWTAEENRIFLEIIEKICGANIWQEVKSDGRLAYRGQPGIRAHYLALFKNLKKGSSNGE